MGIIYLLRLIIPFLFKSLISNFANKHFNSPTTKSKNNQNKKPSSESLGEYIDYEEVE
jgi:hypothetical protein